jgi:hypothetical protein
MGNFLNIIIDKDFYTNGRNDDELFLLSISWFAKFSNPKKIRLSNFNDIELNPNDVFIYVVNKCIYGFSDFLRKREYVELSDRVIFHLKNFKNFKLCFVDSHEALGENIFQKIQKTCLNYGINQEQVYFIDNDYNKKQFLEKYKSKINIHLTNEHIELTCYDLLQYECNFIPNKEFLFLCHNKVVKGHRVILLCKMKKLDILHKTNWSFLYPEKLKEKLYNHPEKTDKPNGIDPTIFKNHFDIVDIHNPNKVTEDFVIDYSEELEFLSNLNSKKSKYEDYMDWFNINPNTNNTIKGQWEGKFYQPITYQESYINITTESNYTNTSSVHVSEKSFLPFLSYQLPIFVASPNHVQSLKEKYDLDLFDDILDHSYDNEFKNGKRIEMICEELIRLSNNENEIIEFYKSNYERFEKNRQKILNYRLKEIDKVYIKENFFK